MDTMLKLMGKEQHALDFIPCEGGKSYYVVKYDLNDLRKNILAVYLVQESGGPKLVDRLEIQ